MSTIDTLFQQAHKNHQLGRLDDAEKLYQKILRRNHSLSEVQYLYGALKMQRGDLKAAIRHAKKAIKLQPGHTGALSNLGFAYTKTGKVDQALNCYHKALESDPLYPEAHYNLARLLQADGHLDEAIVHFKKSIDTRPDHYLSHACLADAYLKAGDYDRALACFEEARKLKPEEAETHHNVSYALRKLGRLDDALASSMRASELSPDYTLAYNTRGLIYEDCGKTSEAESCYKMALSYNPDYVDALSNLAGVYRESERHSEAVELLKKAYSIDPLHVETLNNLGATYRELGDLELARDYYLKALEVNPEYFESLSNLAEVYHGLGEHESAIRLADQILTRFPEQHAIRWNRAFSYFCLGNLSKGWEEYEHRRSIKTNSVRKFPYPEWDGSSLKGHTLLIHGEQGLGDEILFASCYPEMMQQADKVIIDCDRRLVPLFERSFPGALVYGGRPHCNSEAINALGKVDCQIVAGSLPYFTRPDIDSFPDRKAYLMADPVRTDSFQERLKEMGEGLKVGIAWRSRLHTTIRSHSYTDLLEWGPILSVPGIQLLSLQYDECNDELQAVHDQYGVTIHNWDDIDQYNDLDGVAALVSALDLVICVNISVSSFAGALGTPIWKLSIPIDWTTFGLNYNPWYHSMRYFTQSHLGEWSDVISNIAAELGLMVSYMSNNAQHEIIEDKNPGSEDEKIMEQKINHHNETVPLTLKQCREGLILFDSHNDWAGEALEYYGEYAHSEMSILEQLLHEGNVVLETDAGFGINTVKFSRLVGTSGQVMSLEPMRLLFQRLCANLALNGIENVHAYQMGVGEGQAGNMDGKEQVLDVAEQEIVATIPIDNLEIVACDLLCINSAASAVEIMISAENTIDRFKPLIYIRNISEDDQQQVQCYNEMHGYSSLIYEINLYSPDNFLKNENNIFGAQVIRCLLCIPTGH